MTKGFSIRSAQSQTPSEKESAFRGAEYAGGAQSQLCCLLAHARYSKRRL